LDVGAIPRRSTSSLDPMIASASARHRLAKALLSTSSMARILRRTMPKRNNVGIINYADLLEEARLFGILTNGQFRKLMLKHRRALIEADREPLTPQMERIFRNEDGDAHVADRLRRQYWFSWEALTRLALEFEFGERYRAFADQRDGLTTGSSDREAASSTGEGENR
jgi:hypothetical protein